MITVCTALAIVPSSAASYESDEYDAAKEGFTITVKDARGLNAGNFDPGMDVDAIKYLYDNGYNGYDTVGKKYIVEANDEGGYTIKEGTGKGYKFDDRSGILKKMDGNIPHFGGYWHSDEQGSLPINKFPIDMDIHLGDEPVKISGVRVYPRRDSDTSGAIKTYEVWVKFSSDDSWHYLYTDGNKSNVKSTITTSFGYNANVTDIRVRVTESYSAVLSKNVSAFGNYAYFNVGWVTVLKPYNDGSSVYSAAPATVTSANEIDELSVNAVNGRYGWDGLNTARALKGMDSDLSTVATTNGTVLMDLGQKVRFSGIRIYPPKDGQNFRNKASLHRYIKNIALFLTNNDELNMTYTEKANDDFYAEAGLSKVISSTLNLEDYYPAAASGEKDYTKPVTILFGRNITARTIALNSCSQVDINTDYDNGSKIDYGGVGEIRLIKADTADEKYFENTIEWNETPSVTFELSKSGNSEGTNAALFDRSIATSGSPNSQSIYRGYNTVGFNSGETVTMTVDLKKEYTFSAVRVFGRYGQPDQSLMRGILSFSDDGTNWADAYVHMDSKAGDTAINGNNIVRYSSTNDIYTDMKVKTFDGSYNVTARYIKIKVLKTLGNHFSAQEIALVNPDSTLTTLSVADFAGAAVDTRVAGSIEQSKTLDAAGSFVSEMSSEYSSAYSAAQSAYNSAEVKESLSVLFGTATATSPHTKGDGCVPTPTTTTDSGPSIDITPLTDGLISAETDIGRSFIARGDYTVFPNRNEYFHITLPVNTTDSFTAIRFYSRKGDDTTVYNLGNCAENVKVKLYGADGSENVESGVLTATKGRQYTSGSDIMYTDISLKFNDKAVRLTDVSKIEITVLMNFGGENGGNNHWGAEEVRLLNDSTVTNEKTVSELASELEDEEKKNSVKLEIIKAESGIYPATEATEEPKATAATGIIRFITKFNEIKEGTTVTEFGTYVITNENYEKNKELSNYPTAVASYTGKTPVVGDTFSVDVTGITETNWNTPVVAISFVKIEGYNNLIISDIKLLDKVDSANELSK